MNLTQFYKKNPSWWNLTPKQRCQKEKEIWKYLRKYKNEENAVSGGLFTTSH